MGVASVNQTWLFLLGCFGTRLLFALCATRLEGEMLQLAGYLACLPVLGWLYIMLVQRRDTGPEVFGEPIWWQRVRVYHALMWACFAYMAIRGSRIAFVPLLIDAAFGLSAFICHRTFDCP